MNKVSARFASKLLDTPIDPHHGRGGRFGHPGLILICLMLVAGLVTLAVLLFRKARPEATSPVPQAAAVWAPASPAEAILAERFARGEVSVEEFSVARSALRGEWVPVRAGAPMAAAGSPTEPSAP